MYLIKHIAREMLDIAIYLKGLDVFAEDMLHHFVHHMYCSPRAPDIILTLVKGGASSSVLFYL